MPAPDRRWIPIAVAAALLPVDGTRAESRAPRPEEIPAVEATVVVSDFGEFTVRFDREGAPNHVAHFLVLAREGFYDGLVFHRVIPGLLIQTGDPASRVEPPGGPEDRLPWRLPAEPTAGPHERGTVSFAWREDRPGTASSEWFVTLSDGLDLDGRATPIGRVVAGLDVIDRIAQLSTGRDRRPRDPPRVEAIRLQPETPPDATSDGVSESATAPAPTED